MAKQGGVAIKKKGQKELVVVAVVTALQGEFKDSASSWFPPASQSSRAGIGLAYGGEVRISIFRLFHNKHSYRVL